MIKTYGGVEEKMILERSLHEASEEYEDLYADDNIVDDESENIEAGEDYDNEPISVDYQSDTDYEGDPADAEISGYDSETDVLDDVEFGSYDNEYPDEEDGEDEYEVEESPEEDDEYDAISIEDIKDAARSIKDEVDSEEDEDFFATEAARLI